MQNIDENALDSDSIDKFSRLKLFEDPYLLYNWLKAIQDDLQLLPPVILEEDLIEVGGNKQFPELPEQNGIKRGTLYLSTGQYEAVVIAAADKWRRLYDGTTYDPATNIP